MPTHHRPQQRQDVSAQAPGREGLPSPRVGSVFKLRRFIICSHQNPCPFPTMWCPDALTTSIDPRPSATTPADVPQHRELQSRANYAVKITISLSRWIQFSSQFLEVAIDGRRVLRESYLFLYIKNTSIGHAIAVQQSKARGHETPQKQKHSPGRHPAAIEPGHRQFESALSIASVPAACCSHFEGRAAAVPPRA